MLMAPKYQFDITPTLPNKGSQELRLKRYILHHRIISEKTKEMNEIKSKKSKRFF